METAPMGLPGGT